MVTCLTGYLLPNLDKDVSTSPHLIALGFIFCVGCDASFGPASTNSIDPPQQVECIDLIPSPVIVTNENFEGGATGWSDSETDNLEPAAFTEFLGRHGAAQDHVPTEVINKQFTLSGDQDWAILEFDYYQIDSWDNEDFIVYVDGNIYDRRAFEKGEPVLQSPLTSTSFLGPFGNGATPNKTYTLSGNQTQVTIEFDLYQIDSWDDEPFHVYIDDVLVISHEFSGGDAVPSLNGTFPGGSYTASTTQTGELGFGARHSGWRDGIHHYTIILDNAASSLNLRFGMTANEAVYNEAFGVDNIDIQTNAQETIATEDFENGAADWQNSRWYSNAQVTTSQIGAIGFGNGHLYNDGIHHYRLAIPTEATTMTIGFGDALNEGLSNESWGVDNVVLSEACSR